MTYPARTFARNLRHFARSVGIVDDWMFNEIQSLIHRYVRDELEAAYFQVMQEHVLDGRPGLRTFWSSERDEHSTVIHLPDSRYSTMMAMSFDQARPLWVVSPDGGPLRHSTSHVDLWSSVLDLPAYRAPLNRDTRTLIIVPLWLVGRVSGVMHLETVSFVQPTEVAKDELVLLSDAIAILFDLWRASRLRANLTRDAIADLAEALNVARFPKLAKPKVFVAYSGQADSQVVSVIHEVLHEFSDKISVTDWNATGNAGENPYQVTQELVASSFGIFYFSEPAKDESATGYKYVDNANVVFEAGMMHSLNYSSGSESRGWVPIREEDSPSPPFDFAAERVVYIPRTARGELHEARFRQQLSRRMRDLLRAE
jgi:hypothetical protein